MSQSNQPSFNDLNLESTESGTPEAGQNKSPQAIQPKRNDVVSSKFIAWRLIEKLIEPTAPVSSQQTGASSQTSANPAPPSSNSPDKSSDAAQRLIVYKDLLKEASLNKELLTLLLTSQTALVSGALGFYFGGKDNN